MHHSAGSRIAQRQSALISQNRKNPSIPLHLFLLCGFMMKLKELYHVLINQDWDCFICDCSV